MKSRVIGWIAPWLMAMPGAVCFAAGAILLSTPGTGLGLLALGLMVVGFMPVIGLGLHERNRK